MRIDTNHNRAVTGFRNMEEACRRVGTVCAQAQKVEFQRNVPLLCSETQSLHLLAVERFGAGEVDQIRMCQIGIQTGVQSCNTLIHISFQYFGIVRRFVDIGAINLIVDIVLAEQQIVNGILRDTPEKIVKKTGIKLCLIANQDLNASGVFCFQRQQCLDIVLQILWKHMKIRDIAIRKPVWRMLGKT